MHLAEVTSTVDVEGVVFFLFGPLPKAVNLMVWAPFHFQRLC